MKKSKYSILIKKNIELSYQKSSKIAICTFFDFASLCQKRCYFEKTMRKFLNPLPMFYFGVLFINSKYFENHQKSTFSILPKNSEFSCQIHHFGINFKYFRTSTTKCLKTRSN